jgi:hypothetical protein
MFMKIRATHCYLAFMAGALTLLPVSMSLAAETDAAATHSTVVPAPVITTTVAQPKLPYGVDDVLKLSRAQIGDDIIVNYVKNSGTIYNLTSSDIVYLKSAGVSERVINTMIDQKKLAQLAVQTAPAPAPTTAPSGFEADTSYAAPTYTAPTDAGTPADMAVQAPLTPPASSVTVVPYPAATAAYYGSYYPYYGYYGYPGVSFAFGFGPGYYGHGYYGHGHYGHGYYGHGSYAHGGGHAVAHGGGGHGGHH